MCCFATIYTPGHERLFNSLIKLQPSEVSKFRRIWIQRDTSSFLISPLHFFLHSNSSLLAWLFPSSLIITLHIFTLPPTILSPPTLSLIFFMFSAVALLSLKCSLILRCCSPLHSSPPCLIVSQLTYEVVAHSQVIVPHRDLKGFLCQLVQGYFI